MSGYLYVCLILLLASIDEAQCNDKHLICKQVEDVFDYPTRGDQSGTNLPRLQGPPGKMGPKGVKGEKGSKGNTGNVGLAGQVDYDKVNATVQQALETLLERIERLERGLKNITCVGAKYADKCYKILQFSTTKTYIDAEADCKSLGLKPADIESREQYDFLTNYVRSTMTSGDLWLGMTYDTTNGQLKFFDGRVASFVTWYPGYPTTIASHVQMGIGVQSDPASASQGMYNNPGTGSANGMICMS